MIFITQYMWAENNEMEKKVSCSLRLSVDQCLKDAQEERPKPIIVLRGLVFGLGQIALFNCFCF